MGRVPRRRLHDGDPVAAGLARTRGGKRRAQQDDPTSHLTLTRRLIHLRRPRARAGRRRVRARHVRPRRLRVRPPRRRRRPPLPDRPELQRRRADARIPPPAANAAACPLRRTSTARASHVGPDDPPPPERGCDPRGSPDLPCAGPAPQPGSSAGYPAAPAPPAAAGGVRRPCRRPRASGRGGWKRAAGTPTGSGRGCPVEEAQLVAEVVHQVDADEQDRVVIRNARLAAPPDAVPKSLMTPVVANVTASTPARYAGTPTAHATTEAAYRGPHCADRAEQAVGPQVDRRSARGQRQDHAGTKTVAISASTPATVARCRSEAPASARATAGPKRPRTRRRRPRSGRRSPAPQLTSDKLDRQEGERQPHGEDEPARPRPRSGSSRRTRPDL